MDKMIKVIYEITVRMQNAVNKDQYEEIEELLSKRNEMMAVVDDWKIKYPTEEYSTIAKKMLQEILHIDQQITNFIHDKKNGIENSLNELKNKKQASLKYQPYNKQTNGIFVDKTK